MSHVIHGRPLLLRIPAVARAQAASHALWEAGGEDGLTAAEQRAHTAATALAGRDAGPAWWEAYADALEAEAKAVRP